MECAIPRGRHGGNDVLCNNGESSLEAVCLCVSENEVSVKRSSWITGVRNIVLVDYFDTMVEM